MKCQHCNAQWNADKTVESKLTNCPFCGKTLFDANKKCDTIQDVLQEIVSITGIDIFADTRRMLSCFSDVAPQMSKERWLLENFLNCDGGKVFLASRNSSPEEQNIKYLQILNTLQDERFIAETAAIKICEAASCLIFGKHLKQELPVTEEKPSVEKSVVSLSFNSDESKITVPEETNMSEKHSIPITISENAVIKNESQALSTAADSRYLLSDQKIIPRYKYRNQAKSRISIPDSVTKIEEGAFKGCKDLRKIHIPESVTEIMKDVFFGCHSLEEIQLPEIRIISSGTFENCRALKEIIIPDGVKTIGNRAFKDCVQLKKVHIPDSVTEMMKDIFSGCHSLEEIQLPEIRIINSGTFENCSALREIIIPDGVETIGNRAFKNCSRLKKVHIPDSVVEIEEKAFFGCDWLEKIQLPKIRIINSGTFENCSALWEIIIPDGVKAIGNRAFKDCSHLYKVHIPDSVVEIGESAFAGCKNLYEIKIPESVEKIDKNVFDGCKRLKTVYISRRFSSELSSIRKGADSVVFIFHESPTDISNSGKL